jgi:hypothetical protein
LQPAFKAAVRTSGSRCLTIPTHIVFFLVIFVTLTAIISGFAAPYNIGF